MNLTGSTWDEDFESNEARHSAPIEQPNEEANAWIGTGWAANGEWRLSVMALHSSEEWTEEDGVIRMIVADENMRNRERLAATAEKMDGARVDEHTISIAEIQEKGSPGPLVRRHEG